MGRRKIEIKKIDNKNYLKATFSKRRKGLFRKAAELCELSGAEIAIITFSPGGKFYNFGHPTVDSIIARYCGEETSCTLNDNHGCVSHGDDEDLEGKQEREEGSTDEMDEENEPIDGRTLSIGFSKVGEEEEPIDRRMRLSIGFSHKFWWEEPIDEDMDPETRDKYIRSLKELRNNVVWMLNDRRVREAYAKDYLSGI